MTLDKYIFTQIVENYCANDISKTKIGKINLLRDKLENVIDDFCDNYAALIDCTFYKGGKWKACINCIRWQECPAIKKEIEQLIDILSL